MAFLYTETITEYADNIGELINKALHKIEDANESHLKGIFTVDFNSEAILGQTIITTMDGVRNDTKKS